VENGAKFFAVCGLGGMGKTTLAVEVCWRKREKFPGGCFWLTGDDELNDTNLESSLGKFCLKNNLSLDSCSKVDAATTFLETLEDKFLLVIDNLDQNEFSATMDKLVNGRWLQNEHGRVLITTRLEATVLKGKLKHDCSTFTLRGFSDAEGSLFLERRVGKSTSDEVLQKISCELCGLPLALEQAGSFIQVTKCPFETYLKKLEQKKLEVLNKGKAGPKPNEDVLQLARLAVATTWGIHMEWMEINCYPAFYLTRVLSFFPSLGVHSFILNEGSPRIDHDNVADALADEFDTLEAVHVLKLFSLFR